jgi:hypothetical protein
MMKWHDEEFDVEGEKVFIIGEMAGNTVSVRLIWRGIQSTLFTKIVGRGLRDEEPTEEDIENKFGWKIDKFKSNATYASLGRRFQVPESLVSGANDDRPDDSGE